MEIQKAYWATNGNDMRLTMPLTKVDQENRIVSGWATLDSVDSQSDVVLASASKNAFVRFRGNIREMHQPVAVGKMLNFREDMYFDTGSSQAYRGIWVDVYVSKGAPDTWEKVIDGTLTGFSIGGIINDADVVYDETLGKSLKVVTDYDLVELSLVDSPANELANIVSVTKVDGRTVLKGMVAEAKVENIFWCATDEVCITSSDEDTTCPNCTKAMENIGWVEEEDPDKTEKMKSAIAKARGEETQLAVEKSVTVTLENGSSFTISNDATEETIKAITNALEGGNMADNSEVQEDNTDVEAVAAEEVTEAEAVADETAGTEEEAAPEVAAEVSEVDAEEPNFAKMFGDLQAAIEAGLSKNREETTTAINDAVNTFDGKVQELLTKHSELSERVAKISEKTDAVEKALAAVEDDTAVRKSGDLGGSTEESLEKSSVPMWGGRFLSTTGLEEE